MCADAHPSLNQMNGTFSVTIHVVGKPDDTVDCVAGILIIMLTVSEVNLVENPSKDNNNSGKI
jgi:hypothetical protein